MQLGIVVGNVVSTVKTGKVEGLPLLIVEHLDETLKTTSKIVVCTDTVNAKHGEIVLTCSSSSSRFTEKTRGVCTDNTIVAIVDGVSKGKKYIYKKSH
jgi:ethanolamine utilization protein EutN